MDIKERWKVLRKQRNLSISEVSRRTGISRNTITAFEKGLHDIGSRKLEIMIKALDASLKINIEI